jgi:glycosyltransferase involved in cell wall biosynthesis
MNGTLYDPNEDFKKSENPKISIVITVYNGEAYLKTALLSIQNQDFKDVEIIMVDDCSKDNSINLIKELMIKDPRIILYQNEENKGMLYTKTRGVLHAKGKYVMILDVDDIYSQRDAFSTLYLEAEKNNLDILGFGLLISRIHIKKSKIILHYKKSAIIDKNNVFNIMYKCNSHNCKKSGGLISYHFIRTDLFVDIIKQIDEKFLNVKMNIHDDKLMFFLLTRKARNLRQIKRIFYIVIKWQNEKNNTKIQFRLKQKNKNKENLKCLGYINFIEFMLIKTNNNIIDKNIPSRELKVYFLKNKCRFNKNIRKRAIKVLKLFLRNDYIRNEIKKEILFFLNETRQNTIKDSASINAI